MDTLTLSPFGKAHLEGAVRLSRAVSWPHRLEDWALLLSLSKGSVVLDGETVLATTLVTPMGPVATASMIIVDGERRGAGLGRRVMEAAMAQVNPQEWRLTATQDGLPLYTRLGFEAFGEIRQHQGIAMPLQRGFSLPEEAGTADLDTLAALDRAATGMERRKLLAAILAEGRIFVTREAGRIVAFAAQRRFGRGILIGPVVARDLSEAQGLIEPLIAAAEGQFLRMDFDADCGLGEWIAARGLAHCGGGVKMRRGIVSVAEGPQKTFGLAAQAVG
ncbi:MAG: GNAT family N-acetyltransferase [Beijerinckiaceae bacterium]|jgi:GNAT superfamily N-acetyltransferase|nr:GNAT family N-acetyltransferase [Beijerinckiaceae bacterium]